MALSLDNARVEIAWTTTNPLTASPAWEDMTSNVALEAGITWNRGRSDEQANVSPGTCTLSLRNDDGAFTPGRTSATRYPNITIGKRMRVTARAGTAAGNFLSAENASFEGGTIGGWSGSVFGYTACTVTNDATHAQFGTKSMLITWPLIGALGSADALAVSGLTIGRAYTFSAYVWVNAANPAVVLADPFGTLGTLTASSGFSLTTSTTGSFQRIAGTFTAIATSGFLCFKNSGAATAGQQAWIDGIQLDEGVVPGTFTTSAPPIFGRFDGIISSLSAVLDQFGATTVVSASDLLKAVGEIAPLRSMLEQEILADGPTAYYTLAESTDAATAGNTSMSGVAPVLSKVQLSAGGTLTFGTGTGPGFDGLSAASFTPASVSAGLYLSGNGTVTSSGSGVTLECFVNATTAATQTIAQLSGNGTVTLGVSAAGKLTGTVLDAFGGALGSTITSANNVIGGTHHVAIKVDASTGTAAVTLLMDGVSVGTTSFAWGAPGFWVSYNGLTVGGTGSGTLLTGTVSHVAVSPSVVSTARLLAHSNGGLTGFSGELSGTRVARLLGYSVASGLINTEAGSSTVGPQATDNAGALTAAQDVAQTENGVLFAAADGRITFHGRAHRYATTAALVADVEADLGADSMPFTVTDLLLANDVTVSRYGGATQRAVNTASVSAFGPYVQTVRTILDTDAQALDTANWYSNVNSTPSPRVSGLVFDMLTTVSAAKDLAAMGLDIGSRVDVSNLPTAAPASTAAFFVEGVSESISMNGWVTTFTTSPVGVNGSVLVLDDATFGPLDTGGVLAY